MPVGDSRSQCRTDRLECVANRSGPATAKQIGMAALMLATATRDHTMTPSFANTLTLSRIEAGAANSLIDRFQSDNPSRDKGWIGSRAGEDSTQGGVR